MEGSTAAYTIHRLSYTLKKGQLLWYSMNSFRAILDRYNVDEEN